jgi:peptidyl-prolyl cis-trans isomerase C
MTSTWIKSGACAGALMAIAGALGGCKPRDQTAPPVSGSDKTAAPDNASLGSTVARVDGTPISRTVFDYYAKSLANKPPSELTPEQKSQVLDDLINTQLIANQALKDGIEKDSETAARLSVARMRLLADGESQKYLKGKEPTEQELRVEYESALTTMDKNEYHARHILVATKELADQLTQKIKGGAKFEDVARTQSMDNSAKSGGDLGWFSLSRMVKPFGDAVRSLKKGQITPAPVQTQFGWHIIKLEDSRETTPPPFEQAKEQLTNRLLQKKLQAYVEQLKKTAKVEKTL